MKSIVAFETTDGRIFGSETAAELHQTFLDQQSVIEGFMAHEDFPYKSVPQRAIARNTITQWELWKNRGAK